MMWINCKLSEIGTIVGGATPSTKNKIYYNGIINWITPKDLSNFHNRYISRGERNISEEGLKSCSLQLLPKGSVLFSSRAPIGYIAIANNELCTNQGFKSIIPNINTDSLFLYYLLKYNKERIENMGSGTTFKEVSGSVMKNFIVKIPLFKEDKKKISRILGIIDDKIEINNQINNNLEEQAFAIFDSFFPTDIRGDFKVSNYLIPKRGKNLLSKDAIPGIVPVIAGGVQPATYHNVSNTLAPVITISASGANAGYINLWNEPVWSSDSSYIDNTITDNVYFWYVLLKKRQDEIFDSQTGSAQPHIYPQHIGTLPIINLENAKILEYETLVTPMFIQIGYNKQQNANLINLRDSLLPKLMSGEIDVSDIDI